jgi:hypothetical protein
VVDARAIQHFLQTSGYYYGLIDGKIGPQSIAGGRNLLIHNGISSAAIWPTERVLVAVQQMLFTKLGLNPGKKIVVDGIAGPVFQYALELYQNHVRDVTPPPVLVAHQPQIFPRQKDIQRYYGEVGKNQASLTSPYPLYLDWSLSTKITRFSIHEKLHDSAERVMKRVLSHYGQQKIHEMGLDQFGGCLNVRKMRGGSSMSTHSWGIAIDWDADRNQLRYTHKTARLARPEYAKFLDLWAEEGWISLGRERDYDWMHLQAARM